MSNISLHRLNLQTATGAPVFTTRMEELRVTAGQKPLYVLAKAVPEFQTNLLEMGQLARKKKMRSQETKQTFYQSVVPQSMLGKLESETIKTFMKQTTYRPYWPHL